MRILGVEECINEEPIQLCEEILAFKYGEGRFLTCVPRTPNGKIGFIHKVSTLFENYQHYRVLILMSTNVTLENFAQEQIHIPPPTHFRINPSVQDLREETGIPFNDVQQLRLQQILMAPPPPPLANRPRLEIVPIHPRDLMHFHQMPRFRIFPVEGEEEQDHQLQEAIRQSLEQQERDAAVKKPIPLEPGWEEILKLNEEEPEPLLPGQPKCTVCLTSKATICFVNCGHLAACDQCVNIMWTRADIAHACTVCRTPCTRIVRPIVAAVEEVESPQSPPIKVERKKRKQKEK